MELSCAVCAAQAQSGPSALWHLGGWKVFFDDVQRFKNRPANRSEPDALMKAELGLQEFSFGSWELLRAISGRTRLGSKLSVRSSCATKAGLVECGVCIQFRKHSTSWKCTLLPETLLSDNPPQCKCDSRIPEASCLQCSPSSFASDLDMRWRLQAFILIYWQGSAGYAHLVQADFSSKYLRCLGSGEANRMPRCRDNVQQHDDRDCRKIQVLFLHFSDWSACCTK